jgi:sugar O-acyltransferase (sialic acid O-acetyltransferase NeuD family)
MSRRLIVYGASSHGRVVADAARAARWDVLGWADDDPLRRDEQIAGAKVVAIGVDEAQRFARAREAQLAVAVGRNLERRRLCEALGAAGARLATVVHPSATRSATATFGAGTVVLAGAVVGCDAVIGRGVILNTGATVDHDCRIGDWCHLSPGVHLGGGVAIGEGTHLGIGVAVRNDLEIGSWSLVGVGAAVVGAIGDRVVALGVPARPIGPHQP